MDNPFEEKYRPVHTGQSRSETAFVDILRENPKSSIDELMKIMEEKNSASGKILRFRFENSYGASVVNHSLSSREADKLEVCLIRYKNGDLFDDGDFETIFNSPISQYSLEGYLSWNRVEKILEEIELLPAPKIVEADNTTNVIPFPKKR